MQTQSSIAEKPLQVGDKVAFKADGSSDQIHLGVAERFHNASVYVRWTNGFGAWLKLEELERTE